jgi:hypothetical protein
MGGIEGGDPAEAESETTAIPVEVPSSSHEEVLYQCKERRPKGQFKEAAGGEARLTGHTLGDGTGRVHTRSVSSFEYKRCVRDILIQQKKEIP